MKAHVCLTEGIDNSSLISHPFHHLSTFVVIIKSYAHALFKILRDKSPRHPRLKGLAGEHTPRATRLKMACETYSAGRKLRVRLCDSLYERNFNIMDLSTPDRPLGLPFTSTGHEIQCEVQHVFEPCTMSAVMRVRFTDPRTQHPRTGLLKLFDRRCMNNERAGSPFPPPTPDVERRYQTLAGNGGALELTRKWIAEDFARNDLGQGLEDTEMGSGSEKDDDASMESDGEPELWHTDPVVLECRFHYFALKFLDIELRAYKHMAHLQGTHIPSLFGPVVLMQQPCGNSNTPSQNGELSYSSGYSDVALNIDNRNPMMAVPGLLMDFIEDAFMIADMQQLVPRRDWRHVMELAARTVHQTSLTTFINDDVRMENVLIIPKRSSKQQPPTHCECRVVDFSVGTFREPGLSDRDWVDRKHSSGEAQTIHSSVWMSASEVLGKNWAPSFHEMGFYGWQEMSDDIGAHDEEWEWEMDVKRAQADEEEEITASMPSSVMRLYSSSSGMCPEHEMEHALASRAQSQPSLDATLEGKIRSRAELLGE